MRALLFLAALGLWTAPALAQQAQCPGSNASWSAGLPAPLGFMVYDLAPPPGVPVGMLSVLQAQQSQKNQPINTYIGVPQTVATQFPISSNPNQFYNNQIKNVYHQLLLLTTSYCPLLFTAIQGALWTR